LHTRHHRHQTSSQTTSTIITGSVLVDNSLEMEEKEEEEDYSSSSDSESESRVEVEEDEEEVGVEGEYREVAVRLTWASEVVFYEFLEEHRELSPRLEREGIQGVR
jgi:hypothetical protein